MTETATTVRRTAPGGSELPLTEAYDTALLDLDGVVYAGPNAIEYAVESLDAARAAGMRLAYVTNNASRPPRVVAEHLTELGVPAEAADVINSAQAAARVLAEKLPAGAKVLVVGGLGLEEALAERGLVAVRTLAEEPLAVVQGFDASVGWTHLAEASYAVQSGLPWVASNTDVTVPTARGIAPGNGMLVAAVRAATGVEPEVAGKPLPPMHRETVLRTGAKRPLVVGDRLDTDIEGAFNGGVDSLLVFTGVTTAAQLLAAPAEHRPTYLAEDLRGLLTAHAPVTAGEGGGFGCGGFVAVAQDGVLRLEGVGADRWDGLRALCAAAWTALDADGAPVDGRKALAELGF
ncbi:HAD-IIA family hydrolase [Kitasatospora purpeofusca]|uniref:HAD-IIA family hydrolase n=1 Tax=Kitasatospora purpeofusca TaxID=67352 RepID=UPI00225A1D8F|nr:HAD-IIA family hydrolase [Kitasatospora purpeofusca]MCX4688508.1 HAD-IIA family hydrolase [Kitasatospora purpeofusca]MCX4757267.1 HAD-IIA family hydrolase [Kitasatospora purpeofusca]WSR34984.1 HAD-IIA family hydrolase [Kitasatospora purpeofusca]WSR43203.1 HAD-IIA family hydrolase [Kitasatospora purpeofusca]